MSSHQPQPPEEYYDPWCSDSHNPPPSNPDYAYTQEPEIIYGVQEQASSPNHSNQDSNNNNADEKRHTGRQLRGAAVAGGLTGLIFVGPIVGLAAAGGAAIAATTKGSGGNVVRATGEAVSSVGDRLKKMDEKHHVVEKTSKGFVKGCSWVSNRLKPKDATGS
jgi:hypothetical protein